MLTELLSATAWKMTPPEPYGWFHLSFFIAGLLISIAAASRLKGSGEKKNRAVMLTVGSLLLVSEIYKQLFYTVIIGGGEYQWWIFPFQLCSIPMYFCFIAPFLREGRLRDSIYDFMLAFNLMGGFVAFLEPSGLIHEYWTLTLHAFIWHMLIVFLGLYIGFSGRAGRRIAHFSRAAIVFLTLCVIALLINIALFDISNGSINMFYVGPAISPIIVFKSIAAKFGWYYNTPIYISCLVLAAFVFYFPFAARRERLRQRAAANRRRRIKAVMK